MSTPTQVKRPWRATLRTVFQALVSLAAIAPVIAAAIEAALREVGYAVEIQGAGWVALVLACCAAVTKVMTHPTVETWLARFLPFLAASPASKPGRTFDYRMED